MKPYGIISDTHNHNWSAFSTNDGEVNSRLKIILQETERAAKIVKNAGGDLLIHAGDVFHVRGQVAPSVLNPTIETYKRIINEIGVQMIIIAGNHDLENKTGSFYGNAAQALEEVGATVVSEKAETRIYHGLLIVTVPWIDAIDHLKIKLERLSGEFGGKGFDIVIHAPVNGVIMGIPDHGLDDSYLAGLGFNRVFAGHYHNHKDFGNGVYSVGAIAHHTWGDVDSRAGMIFVDDKGDVNFHPSSAPKFIDFNPEWDEEEIFQSVDGNYVRAKVKIEKDSEALELREKLLKLGALGAVVHPIREPKNAHVRGITVNAGASLEVSISDYINGKGYARREQLYRLCEEIISEASA